MMYIVKPGSQYDTRSMRDQWVNCFLSVAIPESGFSANPNTMLVMTSHGGHFGFLEGMGPTINVTWMNRICRQVLTALKNYD